MGVTIECVTLKKIIVIVTCSEDIITGIAVIVEVVNFCGLKRNAGITQEKMNFKQDKDKKPGKKIRGIEKNPADFPRPSGATIFSFSFHKIHHLTSPGFAVNDLECIKSIR